VPPARARDPAPRPYFPSLDGLRCLAIVPIVWHHSTPRPLEGLLGRGPLGVDLFFVVSGFLITTLLLHERKQESLSLSRFWIRRSLRIFPLYYCVLIAYVVHALLIRDDGPERTHFLRSVPLYATYTSNWFTIDSGGHPIIFAFAWSLAAEEQFYLLWPPVLRWLRGTLLPLVVMLSLVVLDQCAERGLLALLVDQPQALRIVRSFATPIGLGAMLALLEETPGARSVVRAFVARRSSSVVALALVLAATAFAWPLLPTHLALTAFVGACALRRDHFLAPVLENRLVSHVGMVSYGVYLWNVSVVSLARRCLGHHDSALLVFLVSMCGSVALATLTHRWIERPWLELRERFRKPASESDLVPRITA
jgi:peptidoglycan/LPS O-acetylase OafA/YrhL